MRFESKSAPALAGLLSAALIALSGCGSDSGSSSEPETTPTATLEVVEQGFDSPAEFSDYVAQSLDSVEVSLESETNPDFNQETEPERLHVHFDSTEDRVKDLEATAYIVQATSRAGFDYDILVVTGVVSAGEWAYLYDRSTVEELTADGQIDVADIWDSAEQSFDTIHR
ncbi:hypothetical protein BI49514_01134 [Brevibacterium iodinum ATCC 49514]|uniref:Lipoprotein n=1 Tax=Brevibacterium iodinum ATCC 49514 TaxID=1255616 RepID=A0A2H1INA3_9MICO|nr:hypothetical protein [Brevibacterium iodinum]SMX76631.1 hypothetical protein BI49514_01134 [Brevibacterium iodinum ATCC 49514]SUW11848.1 Uncharacterised protein [Brevibacterium iodinum]